MTSVGRDNDPNARSGLAIAGLVGSVVPGALQTYGVDRPRILLARSHAREAGTSKQWMLNMVTGKPTSNVVPLSGGTMRIGSRVLTNNAWMRSHQLSTALGALSLGAGLMVSVPNLIDGARRSGDDGILSNRSGRTGVFSLGGAALGVGVLGATGIAAVRAGGPGSAFMRALSSPLHAHPGVIGAGIALAAPVVANELGFFDFMNAGETRTAVEVAHDTPGRLAEVVRDFLDGADD